MRLLDRINPWRRIRMLIALNKRLNEDLEIESEAHAMEQAEAVRQFSRAGALQDELEKLKADLKEAEEDTAELRDQLDKVDIEVGNALESIGRFPPKPAGFWDRIDDLISTAKQFKDELDKLKTDYHNLVGNASFSSVDMSFARRRIGKLEATLKLALAVIVTKVNPLDVDAKWYRESMDLVPLDSKKG